MSKKSRQSYKQIIKAQDTTLPASKSTEFNPDYSDVKRDLKRIGILASTFFVVLIALTFVLR